MKKTILFLFYSTYLLALYTPKNYQSLLGMEGFSNSLLKMHFKLYEGYVKNTNALLDQLSALDPISYEYGALKRRLGWEFDGMRLHELYFDHLGGSGTYDQKSPLILAIIAQFGSFEKWKKDFVGTGMIRGIGWAVLYLDPQSKKLFNTWINEHDVGHLAGGSPIIIMDVFEHAYITEYGLDRMKYIEAFFKNLNWSVANSRFLNHKNAANKKINLL